MRELNLDEIESVSGGGCFGGPCVEPVFHEGGDPPPPKGPVSLDPPPFDPDNWNNW